MAFETDDFGRARFILNTTGPARAAERQRAADPGRGAATWLQRFTACARAVSRGFEHSGAFRQRVRLGNRQLRSLSAHVQTRGAALRQLLAQSGAP